MRTSLRRIALVAAAITAATIVSTPAEAAFPDQGNRILYARLPGGAPATFARGSGAVDLFSIKNNGDARRRVTRSANVAELGGHTSPDGDEIVYWGVSEAGGYRVYVANADGSQRAPLTSNPVSMNPNWSRNGRQIVYVKSSGAATLGPIDSLVPGRRGMANTELMVMDADGTGKHSILSTDLYGPGWSPTDNLIAFTAPTKGGYGIWHVRPNGDGLSPVLDIPGTAVFADWSPDGRRMLYQFQEPIETAPQGPIVAVEIWTVRKNGSDPQLVADDAAEITFLPRFSDDGDRVIYVKNKDGNPELYSTRSDGSGGKSRLTETTATEWLDRLLA